MKTIKNRVARVSVVEEAEAEGKVKDIYNDIKKTLGICFIPNMYKAMANKPDYLESTWNKVQSIMTNKGLLDEKTKDIIALTVSIMSGCDYCIDVYTDTLKHHGCEDQELVEIYSIIDNYIGLNRFNLALGVEADQKPWYGCGGK